MRLLLIFLPASTLLLAAGPAKTSAGACSLIPPDAIQKVFGERVANAKPDSQVNGELSYSQCFYSLPTFANSISIAVASPSPADTHHDAARELWNRRFHGEDEDKDRDAAGQSEEREAAAKAAPLEGLGEEAFWVHSFVGNLYVLKGNAFLRISIGGKFTDEERRERAKALAAAALKNIDRFH